MTEIHKAEGEWNLAGDSRPRLLIVDDQPANIRALHEVFAGECDVFMATKGADALEFCAATPPDLVLLDVVMPGIDGLEVCRQLKSSPLTANVPVVFVTSQGDPGEENACWEAGAVDFINKPINVQTTRNRVRAHLMLKRQADTLRRLAWIDGLTGIANKRQFDLRIREEINRCRRGSLYLTLVAIDIDHFKAYNDAYGHLQGDDCLRKVAQSIHASMLRSSDLIARTGGEEFTCILPELGPQDAREIAARIERLVRELGIVHELGIGRKVTVSLGVDSSIPGIGDVPESLIERADRALYQAKKAGRSRAMFSN
jgi:diguanylate cyclase (GGDEF)-like protein